MTTNPTMPESTRQSIRHTLAIYGPEEARFALSLLESGKVDGSTFGSPGHCGCLIGSLAVGRLFAQGDPDPINAPRGLGFKPETARDIAIAIGQYKSVGMATAEAQWWFEYIRHGDTPANSPRAALAAEVIRQWLSEQTVDLAPANPHLQPESTAQAISRLLKAA